MAILVTHKKLIGKIKTLPEDKIKEIENFVDFIYFKMKDKIPNEITEKVFRDTDQGKNLTEWQNADDMFENLGI